MDQVSLGELRAGFREAFEQWIERCNEFRPESMFAGAKVRAYQGGGVYEGVYALELRNGQRFKFRVEDMPVFRLA
jgi:hypothetical protein